MGPQWRCSSESSAGIATPQHCPRETGIGSSGNDGQAGWPERQAGARSNDRMRLEVPDRGPQLGREVEDEEGRLFRGGDPVQPGGHVIVAPNDRASTPSEKLFRRAHTVRV